MTEYNMIDFISWFINQFIAIGTTLLQKLDQIKIFPNVSLMNFIITILILGMLIDLIISAPRLGIINRSVRAERRKDDK